MKNKLKSLLPIIKGFAFCGIALQIVLGILYMVGNMMTVPEFWETTIYAEIAEQFVLDEYMTYLYPMLVKVVKFIPIVNYQIIINAKVDEKNLLDNYAAMVRSMGNPGFMVKCQDPDLKAAFSGFLSELGFKVVTREEDAAFIVDGNCEYLAAKHDYYGEGIQINLNLRLIDKKSGQEFFNISNDPRFTTSFSGSFHQLRQSSAKKSI